MTKKQKKSKKKFWIIVSLLIVCLSLILISLFDGYNFLVESFLNYRKVIFLLLLALFVLYLILMVFYKSARKVWPFAVFFALFLITAVISLIMDYCTTEASAYAVTTVYRSK